jgi:hypothetical protein
VKLRFPHFYWDVYFQAGIYLSKSVIFPSLTCDIWHLEISPIFSSSHGTACNFLSSVASPKSAVGRCFRPVALPLRSPLPRMALLWMGKMMKKWWEHDVLIISNPLIHEKSWKCMKLGSRPRNFQGPKWEAVSFAARASRRPRRLRSLSEFLLLVTPGSAGPNQLHRILRTSKQHYHTLSIFYNVGSKAKINIINHPTFW